MFKSSSYCSLFGFVLCKSIHEAMLATVACYIIMYFNSLTSASHNTKSTNIILIYIFIFTYGCFDSALCLHQQSYFNHTVFRFSSACLSYTRLLEPRPYFMERFSFSRCPAFFLLKIFVHMHLMREQNFKTIIVPVFISFQPLPNFIITMVIIDQLAFKICHFKY